MFRYLINIFRQLRKIFGIKGILEVIHTNLHCDEEEKSLADQQKVWLDLKTRIFSCGSLYVKFLQWYISKLKSNTLDNQETTYTNNLHAFVAYFEDIFENCPFHSLDDTLAVFASEGGMIGVGLEQYIHIESLREIASGSIGQIYYARRLSDNREIAIKVKHPDITRNLAEQISLIRLLSYIQSFAWVRRRYNLIFSIDDFLADINQQCDFNNEADNNTRFRENFQASSDYIVFPEVLFQSQDVLVSHYIHGRDFTSLSSMQQYMTAISFVCFFYQMLFVDNFIHGDLHCKNWKVYVPEHHEGDTNAPSRVKIVVYDTGICFSNRNKTLSRDFWLALGKYDLKGLKSVFRRFVVDSEIKNNLSDEELALEIDKMFEVILEQSVGTSMIMKSIINYCASRNIIIDKFLLNMSITICLLEEFFRKTDMVNREKCSPGNGVSMYDIINENALDIIAFCKVKECYPGVLELFQNELETKYLAYQVNLQENNIKEVEKNNQTPVLFNGLALSGLKMRAPGSSSSNDTMNEE